MAAPSQAHAGAPGTRGASSLWIDLPVAVTALALFYLLLALARYWAAPVEAKAPIDLRPLALPLYALYSLARLVVAYIFSLGFSIAYGAIAARSRRAERILIPLLDTLQSIPVLCFLPPVMLAMMAIFPTRQIGLELGSILLIFTGQVWNMAFSVYASLKTVPAELGEAARLYGFSRWQRLTQLELPYTAVGLIWNSMMSVAGAWFALMVCEMFVLGNHDLRLPGLGSYLQTASNAGNTGAIAWGLGAMIAVILLLDQLVWRPLIAWSEKFKFEQVEGSDVPRSPILDLLRRSHLLARFHSAVIAPAAERLLLGAARANGHDAPPPRPAKGRQGFEWSAWIVVAVFALYAVARMLGALGHLTHRDLAILAKGSGATFLRVEFALALAVLWTVPVGVAIGLKPKLAARAQPLAQVAASIPAPALFPAILMILIQHGGGLNTASIVLLLLGTQWYVLFNVIAGASAIPSDLKEVCGIYGFSRLDRWRKLFLPAIFPYLITGVVTASGGAWNASIIAEYVRFRGHTYELRGLGATISRATDAGNTPLLLGATLAISAMVILMNRLVWRRLYRLASTRFKLEFS